MSKVYISRDAYPQTINYIEKQGHEVVIMQPTDLVYPEVSCHSDIYMCRLGSGSKAPVLHLKNPGEIGYKYPENIAFNGAVVGKYFIHNLKHTAPRLMAEVQKLGLTTIDVNQGYTKCNLVVVDDSSCITSDEGLYRSLSPFLDVLLIEMGQVQLPGFSYGFLGGCSGRIGDLILFNGDLSAHSCFQQIEAFIGRRGLQLWYPTGQPLLDIGSIIAED